ncbi:MAG: tyrosine-type recombinase/integrase, partial [Bryobacteraceae bacterium]
MIEDYRKLRAASRPVLDVTTEHYNLLRLSEMLGDVAVAHLKPDDLLAYAHRRADAGAGPYTVNMEIGKLGTMMRLVAAHRRMSLPDVVQQARPLLAHLKLIGGGGRRERRPTEDELERILEWMERRERGAMYADMVRFAVGTAMRRGEIVRIRWGDLDEQRRLVLVRDRKDPRQKAGNDQWASATSGMVCGDTSQFAARWPRMRVCVMSSSV